MKRFITFVLEALGFRSPKTEPLPAVRQVPVLSLAPRRFAPGCRVKFLTRSNVENVELVATVKKVVPSGYELRRFHHGRGNRAIGRKNFFRHESEVLPLISS
jgi:hypothetical protein